MTIDPGEAVALFRFHLIAEAVDPAVSSAERGLIIRGLASFAHQHPDGTMRTYSRGTLDRWVRAYRARGLAGLMPVPRSDTGAVRRHPELLADRRRPAGRAGGPVLGSHRRHPPAPPRGGRGRAHHPGPPAPPGPAPRRHRRRAPGLRAL